VEYQHFGGTYCLHLQPWRWTSTSSTLNNVFLNNIWCTHLRILASYKVGETPITTLWQLAAANHILRGQLHLQCVVSPYTQTWLQHPHGWKGITATTCTLVSVRQEWKGTGVSSFKWVICEFVSVCLESSCSSTAYRSLSVRINSLCVCMCVWACVLLRVINIFIFSWFN
jgi:hypothetical protein